MDYNFGSLGDVQLIDTSTGEVIGAIQDLSFSEVDGNEIYERSNTPFNFQKSYSVTLEDITVNYDVLSQLLGVNSDPAVRIVMQNKKLTRYKYLQKRTKNRRIKNKLLKKINKIDHPVFNEGIKMKYSDITFN